MNEKKTKQGSYTVESSLIVPFLLFVIFALCYLTFYLYDKIVIETEMNRFLRRAELGINYDLDELGCIPYSSLSKRELYGFMKNEYAKQEEELTKELVRTLQKRLINYTVKECKVEMEWNHSKIHLSGKWRNSIPVVRDMLGKMQVAFQVKKNVHNPCESVRRWETLSEIITH